MASNLITLLLFVVSVLLLDAPLSVHCHSDTGHSQHIYIIPNDTAQCAFNGSCETLNSLASNADVVPPFNVIVMQLLPGVHRLTKQGSISFGNISSVYLVSDSIANRIICYGYSNFEFSFLQNVAISNITFENCGVSVSPWLNRTVALSFNLVLNLNIENTSVVNSKGIGIAIRNSLGHVSFQSLNISSSTTSNMLVIWDDEYANTTLNRSQTVFTLENSYLINGGKSTENDSDVFSGGLDIRLLQKRLFTNILLKHVFMLSNAGRRGGNIGITIQEHTSHGFNITLENCHIEGGRALSGGGFSMLATGPGTDTCNEELPLNSFHRVSVINSNVSSNYGDEAGGMVAKVDNLCQKLNMLVSNTHFIRNVARPHTKRTTVPITIEHGHSGHGGGALFKFFNIPTLSVVPFLDINKCSFTNNEAEVGGGLSIIHVFSNTTELKRNRKYTPKIKRRFAVVLKDMKVFNNSARRVGGINLFTEVQGSVEFVTTMFSYQYVHNIFLEKLTLSQNTCLKASTAMHIVTKSYPDNTNQFISTYIFFKEVDFIGNHYQSSVVSDHTLPSSQLATLSLLNTPSVSFTNCSFQHNSGSALTATESNIRLKGNILFANNTALVGAGMALYASHVIVSRAQVTFINNRARFKGGGIYVEDIIGGLSGYNSVQCFLRFENNLTDREDGISIEFIENSAGLAGSDLYGGHIDLCESPELPLNTFLHFDNKTMTSVSSDALRVCICNDGVPNCDVRHIHVDIEPRRTFVLSVVAVGQRNGITTSLIKASFDEMVTEYHQFLHGELQDSYSMCTNMEYSVSSNRDSELLLLSPFNSHLVDIAYKDLLQLNVTFRDCPRGFVLSGTPLKCRCAPILVEYGLSCNDTTFSLSRKDNVWTGMLRPDILLVQNPCPFDYCTRGDYEVSFEYPDEMCSFNRTGILCGKCSKNTSLVFGTSRCKECSDNFIALLLVFALAGILLIVVLTALNLTVTEGTVNGLIFYASVLHLNKLTFFPAGDINLLTVFVSWMNLDFGIDACFYNGMTTCAKMWLQFVFPIYVWIILTLTITFSQYSSRAARLSGARNRVKVMSTLFFLSYLKILRTAFSILSFTHVSYSDGTVKKVWLYDGNIEYLHGKHIALFTISVIVIVFLTVPYSALILCVQCWQRLPHFRWRFELYAVLDSYAGPFKTRNRFWIGLLLLVYTGLLVLFSFTGGERLTNLAAIVIACSVLLFMKVLFRGVYKKWAIDVLEAFFLINLVVISAFTLSVSHSNEKAITPTTHLIVSLAFVAFLVILVYHFCRELLQSLCRKLVDRVKTIPLIQRLMERCFPETSSTLYSDYYHLNESFSSVGSSVQFSSDYQDLSLVLPTYNTCTDTNGERYRENSVRQNKIPRQEDNLFREDPVLLSMPTEKTSYSEVQARLTPNESMNASVPHTVCVLVTDRDEEHAVLIKEESDPVRVQKRTIDNEGGATIVIENCPHKDQSTPSNEVQKRAQGENFPLAKKDFVIREKPVGSFEHVKTSKVQGVPGGGSKPLSQSDFVIQRSLMRKNRRLPLFQRKRLNVHKKIKRGMPVFDLKGTVYSDYAPPKCLIDPVCVMSVTCAGIKYQSELHDISFKVPAGALARGTTAKIEMGVLLHGPFSFPPNVKPVSPIVWICSHENIHFQKPFELTLPHIFDTLDIEEANDLALTFMKAHHNAFQMLTGGGKRFEFSPVDKESSSSFSSCRGVLQSDHFCFFCIVAKNSRKLFEKARYCLTRIEPSPWPADNPDTTIYFCVSYFMKTCLEAVKKQFQDGFEVKSHEMFHFASRSDVNTEPRIAIEITQLDPNSGWFMLVENQRQVAASKIDFWQYKEEELQLMDSCRMYPPRFQVRVSGIRATQPSFAQVTFNGTAEDIGCSIYLVKAPEVRPLSRSSTRYSLSSLSDDASFRSTPSTGSRLFLQQVNETEEFEDYSGLDYAPEMSELLNEVVSKVASKWYVIGVQLKVKTEDLDKISKNYEGVDHLCLEVFKTWKRSMRSPFTWATMIRVLKTPAVEEIALAECLKMKLARPVAYSH